MAAVTRQGAGQVEFSMAGDAISKVGVFSPTRAARVGLHEAIRTHQLGLQVTRIMKGLTRHQPIEVGVGADRGLVVVDVQHATGAVRTCLVSLYSQEEDGGEDQQDRNDDRELDER